MIGQQRGVSYRVFWRDIRQTLDAADLPALRRCVQRRLYSRQHSTTSAPPADGGGALESSPAKLGFKSLLSVTLQCSRLARWRPFAVSAWCALLAGWPQPPARIFPASGTTAAIHRSPPARPGGKRSPDRSKGRSTPGRWTFAFGCSKAHGEQLVRESRQAGVAACWLPDQTSEEVREHSIARLEAGRTLVLVSCFLLSYGIDTPCVECIVLARPTRSLVLYLIPSHLWRLEPLAPRKETAGRRAIEGPRR